ncbi:MAG: hypothetical protein QF793_02800 [Candidatus Peribacteraceae bacterium]|jgi:hypothetical protein|nr:hypothetical protein [Candidatus Peribacteraceae bacterium]
MKRFPSFLASLLCVASLAAPTPAYAMNWDWVPRVLRFDNPYRGLDVTRYPGFECKIKNSWGDCVVYSYVDANRPDNHPGGGTPKNYYRRVSSFGGNLNYSDCQLDDYKRGIAPRTYHQTCDYGQPRTYEN